MPFSQFDERVILATYGNFAFGTSPGSQVPFTGAAFGSRIDQLIFTWNGAAPTSVTVHLDDGFGDNADLGTVQMAGASVGEITTLDVIALLLPDTQPYILLGKGGQISIVVDDTYTGTDVLGYYITGGDF